MSYEVRAVTEEAELRQLAAMAVAAYGGESTLCRTDLRCVTLGDLRRVHRVYGAYLDGRPVGLFTCSERGQGAWLNGYREHLAAVCAAIAPHMAAEFGTCWGAMENPKLRSAIVVAGDGQIVDDAGVLRWVG